MIPEEKESLKDFKNSWNPEKSYHERLSFHARFVYSSEFSLFSCGLSFACEAFFSEFLNLKESASAHVLLSLERCFHERFKLSSRFVMHESR